MAAIFISHSSRDNECADQVKTWLAQEGYERVFLDFDKHTGMQAGEHWERRLYEEVERCHAVILILTPNWLESKWCFVEFAQARALGKIIFPIVFSPVGDTRVAPEIQGVDLKDWNPEGQEHLRRRIREIAGEVARGFTWDRSRSPYPGIHSFDREDAAIYFGRDAEIREVIERLEARRVQGGKRLVLVLGASGSGKSSLLKAGVLPQLDRERSRWIVLPSFRPEREPLTNFAKALAERCTNLHAWRVWRDRLVSSKPLALLKEVADDLRLGKARGATVLVAIDQFEEAFTVADPEEGGRFLDLRRRQRKPGEGYPIFSGQRCARMFWTSSRVRPGDRAANERYELAHVVDRAAADRWRIAHGNIPQLARISQEVFGIVSKCFPLQLRSDRTADMGRSGACQS